MRKLEKKNENFIDRHLLPEIWNYFKDIKEILVKDKKYKLIFVRKKIMIFINYVLKLVIMKWLKRLNLQGIETQSIMQYFGLYTILEQSLLILMIHLVSIKIVLISYSSIANMDVLKKMIYFIILMEYGH